MAAGAMTLPLLALGVDHLTAVQWVIGLVAGGLVYAAVLLITRELSSHEVRSVAERLRSGLSRNPPANHRSAHPGG